MEDTQTAARSVRDDSDRNLVIRRTPWDVILGVLLVLSSLFLFGNVLFATAISVFLVAWTSLSSGIVVLLASLFRMKSGSFWSGALGGAVLIVIGIFILRNPVIGAVALTLMVGSTFLASGLTRVVGAAQVSDARWLLVFSGIISVALGVWVLFNIAAATAVLLGVIIAIQILTEGLTMILVGRLRPAKVSA
nr:sulfate permease [Actinomycetales bacterium]